ncbi:heme A synthase [Oceanobacillus sp. J11TS1]|nr:heme A synthase [Oceanobacillus sp. J11TS1]
MTKTGSADGCGDSWPLCEGELLPSNLHFEMIIELSHRMVSGAIGILVLLLAILSWIAFRHHKEVIFLSFSALFFIAVQALVGAAAVVWGQSDFLLATHFGISLICFAAVFLLMLLFFEIDKKLDTENIYIKKPHRIEIYAISIYTMCVVYSGALVRHTDSNLVCSDWPFCSNSNPLSLGSYTFNQWVQMGHRFAASILFLWTIFLTFRMIKKYRKNNVMYWGWLITCGLIALQVVFGALVIFTHLNLVIALMHALFITCYFGMLSYFIHLSFRSSRKKNGINKVQQNKDIAF